MPAYACVLSVAHLFSFLSEQALYEFNGSHSRQSFLMRGAPWILCGRVFANCRHGRKNSALCGCSGELFGTHFRSVFSVSVICLRQIAAWALALFLSFRTSCSFSSGMASAACALVDAEFQIEWGSSLKVVSSEKLLFPWVCSYELTWAVRDVWDWNRMRE